MTKNVYLSSEDFFNLYQSDATPTMLSKNKIEDEIPSKKQIGDSQMNICNFSQSECISDKIYCEDKEELMERIVSLQQQLKFTEENMSKMKWMVQQLENELNQERSKRMVDEKRHRNQTSLLQDKIDKMGEQNKLMKEEYEIEQQKQVEQLQEELEYQMKQNQKLEQSILDKRQQYDKQLKWLQEQLMQSDKQYELKIQVLNDKIKHLNESNHRQQKQIKELYQKQKELLDNTQREHEINLKLKEDLRHLKSNNNFNSIKITKTHEDEDEKDNFKLKILNKPALEQKKIRIRSPRLNLNKFEDVSPTSFGSNRNIKIQGKNFTEVMDEIIDPELNKKQF